MREHPGLCFSLKEFQRRLTGLRARMSKRGLEIVMIADPENLMYLTGYQTTGYGAFQALFVPLEGEPFMVTRLLEESNAITRTWVEHTRTFRDTDDPLKVTIRALAEFGYADRVLGVERNCFFLPFQIQERLLRELEGRLADCSGIVEPLRAAKSDEELAVMRLSARATEAAMDAGIQAVRAGITENDIAAEMHHAMFTSGGEYPAVAPYVASGPRSAIGHATWEGRRIEKDEVVFLEAAGCYRRYHTAMMRTVFTGANPPRRIQQAVDLINEDIDALMAAMRPGVTAGEIDTLRRIPGRLEKIGATRFSRTGYSLGIAFAPSWDEGHIVSLREGDDMPLEENMTFHLIPFLQLPDVPCFIGISETVYVTPNGAKSIFDGARNPERRLYLAP